MNIDRGTLYRHQAENWLRGLLLISGLAALLCLIGWVIAGGAGVAWALGLGVILLLVSARIPPRLILARSAAQQLPPSAAPVLHAMLQELAARAGLGARPMLWYVPSPELNAFAVGTRNNGAIAVTAGLLRTLPRRALAGVLAHEISHLRHNDTWVMTLAAMLSEVTAWLALIGQLLLLALLPLVLRGDVDLPWLALMLLAIAPTASTLLQLALSRNREFAADLEAVNLTGDPQGLADALSRLESNRGIWLENIFLPRRNHTRLPRWLRTHPDTGERIERLLAMLPKRRIPPLMISDPSRDGHLGLSIPDTRVRRPRRSRVFRL